MTAPAPDTTRAALLAWVKEQVGEYSASLALLDPREPEDARLIATFKSLIAKLGAIAALLEGDGWEPIETAPKDTPILITSDGHVEVVKWNGEEWASQRFWFYETADVTGWQPLPAPPATSERKP